MALAATVADLGSGIVSDRQTDRPGPQLGGVAKDMVCCSGGRGLQVDMASALLCSALRSRVRILQPLRQWKLSSSSFAKLEEKRQRAMLGGGQDRINSQHKSVSGS